MMKNARGGRFEKHYTDYKHSGVAEEKKKILNT